MSVPNSQKAILGFGFLAVFFSSQAVGILAIPYYQMTLGVDPFYLSLAMKMPIILACFVSPLVGHLSDRTQSSMGRRRPFLLIAPWLSALIFGLMWMVPAELPAKEQIIYFALLVTLFYFVTTFWTVPFKCLTYEISDDHDERTIIMAVGAYFIKFASFIAQWLFPLAKLSIFGGLVVGIQFIGWGIGLIFFGLCTLIPALLIKERKFAKEKTNSDVTFLESLKVVISNKNMLIVISLIFAQFLLGSFSINFDYYVLVYYVTNGDVGDGAILKGILSSAYAVAGWIAIVIVSKLALTYGKRKALKVVYCLTFIGGILKWFIFQPNAGWWVGLDAVFGSFIWAGMGVVLASMLADICDEDEYKFNVRREGIFVGVQKWAFFICFSISGITSGLTLNLIDFDANLGSSQPESTILWMRLLLCGGTMLSALLGYLIIGKYSLSKEKCKEMSKHIKQKNNNSTVTT